MTDYKEPLAGPAYIYTDEFISIQDKYIRTGIKPATLIEAAFIWMRDAKKKDWKLYDSEGREIDREAWIKQLMDSMEHS